MVKVFLVSPSPSPPSYISDTQHTYSDSSGSFLFLLCNGETNGEIEAKRKSFLSFNIDMMKAGEKEQEGGRGETLLAAVSLSFCLHRNNEEKSGIEIEIEIHMHHLWMLNHGILYFVSEFTFDIKKSYYILCIMKEKVNVKLFLFSLSFLYQPPTCNLVLLEFHPLTIIFILLLLPIFSSLFFFLSHHHQPDHITLFLSFFFFLPSWTRSRSWNNNWNKKCPPCTFYIEQSTKAAVYILHTTPEKRRRGKWRYQEGKEGKELIIISVQCFGMWNWKQSSQELKEDGLESWNSETWTWTCKMLLLSTLTWNSESFQSWVLRFQFRAWSLEWIWSCSQAIIFTCRKKIHLSQLTTKFSLFSLSSSLSNSFVVEGFLLLSPAFSFTCSCSFSPSSSFKEKTFY